MCDTDSSAETSDSFFYPSGVSSNAQAKKRAKGNPIAPMKKTKVTTQSGRSKAGTASDVT